MSEEEIFAKLKDIVSKQLSIDPAKIKTDSNFTSDLEADSLDVVELVMTFEEEFDILIEDENAGELATVQDAVNFILKETK